jgi:DNA primase
MNSAFDDTAKEEVRLRADIAAVVGRYVKLRQSGATLKGLCPFHKEKTPSFHVNPSRGFFHCFGCGKGGDVFRFLQEIEGVSFPEALTMLAEETGVTLAPRQVTEQAAPGGADPSSVLSKTAMLDIHKITADFFYRQIRKFPEAIEYFKSRGLAAETVRDFKLGYSPPGWTALLSFAAGKNIGTDALAACGLAIKKDDGSAYDRFRDRVMFSLFDLSGRVVGFAGRGRDKDATPKYLNSPETSIYRKKEFLYGLNVTRQYIKDEKYALVVEGYMDFLTLYQAGIRNVVATSGTAMTTEHGHLLKRFAPAVVLVFDGDAAGQTAAQRGVFTLAPLDLDVSVLVLPADEDPDSFVKKNGAEPFRALIKKARPSLDFIIEKTIDRHGMTPRGKKAAIEELAPLEASMTNALARGSFKKTLAERLGIDEKMVYQLMRSAGHTTGRNAAPAIDDDVYMRSLEGSFLHLLITRPELIAQARQYITPQTLTDAMASDIYSIVLNLFDEKGNLDGLIDHVAGGEAQRIVSRMLVTPALEEHIQEELVQKIIHLRAKFLRARIRDIKVLLKQPDAARAALLSELKECSSQLKDLEEGE